MIHRGTQTAQEPQTMSTTRNQVLKRKFFAHKSDMPPHINHMFDSAHEHPDGERQRRSDIINNLFEKKGKKWVVNYDKPMFQEAKVRFYMASEALFATGLSRDASLWGSVFRAPLRFS